MECPKCQREMLRRTFNRVTVDRCTGCFGLFCEPAAIEDGKEVWLAEAVVDIGYPGTGARYNTIDDIDCPECEVKMDKISDPEQTHIWMETCPQCNKIFLDAGEFTDLKYNTVLDRIRGWRKGRRP